MVKKKEENQKKKVYSTATLKCLMGHGKLLYAIKSM